MSNILCIGSGYVDGPTMAVIAKHCPQHEVRVVDINPERVAAWAAEQRPIYNFRKRQPGKFLIPLTVTKSSSKKSPSQSAQPKPWRKSSTVIIKAFNPKIRE